MKNSSDPKHGIQRRDLLKGAAAVAGIGLTSGVPTLLGQSPSTGSLQVGSGQSGSNPIQIENAKRGTRDWMLTKVDVVMNEPVELWRSPRIEGYCSETSVAAGERLKVMVSANPVSQFDLEIYRTGYYGGKGGRFMKKFSSIQGKTQPDPEIVENRLRECKWEPSVEFKIPKNWLSGVYLGKLTAKEEGFQSYVIFIVRDERPCDLLFQCSDITWATYNSWPTNEWSLYHNDANGYNGAKKRKKWSTDAADTGWVSFDRPYAQFCQDHLVVNTKSVGSGEFLLWEFPLSYWIEQEGYDVSYISNVDTHTDGPGLKRAKGFISAGHDEYWTPEMYDNVSAARDAGVNLAFLSGNSVWGVIPLLPSHSGQAHRVIRREGKFLGAETYQLLQESRGEKHDHPPGPSGAKLMGGRTAGIGGGAWTCTRPQHWLYEGTGMKAGDTVPGLVGWEWHGAAEMNLPGMEVVAEGPMMPDNGRYSPHAATIYDGPSNNIVFNAGTIWWAQGLSSPPGHVLPAHRHAKPQGPDPRVQRMMYNVFDRFIR